MELSSSSTILTTYRSHTTFYEVPQGHRLTSATHLTKPISLTDKFGVWMSFLEVQMRITTLHQRECPVSSRSFRTAKLQRYPGFQPSFPLPIPRSTSSSASTGSSPGLSTSLSTTPASSTSIAQERMSRSPSTGPRPRRFSMTSSGRSPT